MISNSSNQKNGQNYVFSKKQKNLNSNKLYNNFTSEQ